MGNPVLGAFRFVLTKPNIRLLKDSLNILAFTIEEIDFLSTHCFLITDNYHSDAAYY